VLLIFLFSFFSFLYCRRNRHCWKDIVGRMWLTSEVAGVTNRSDTLQMFWEGALDRLKFYGL